MDEVEQEDLRAKLRGRFNGLPSGLVDAAVRIYHEIEKYHERNVRLTAAQFSAARRDFDLLRKCVIYLVATEWAKDPNAPLLLGMRSVPEMGGRRGWVRVVLKLPSKPPPREH